MKVCVYLEFLHFLGGAMYKNVGTGILSSYRNQLRMLNDQGIPVSGEWTDDCSVLMANLAGPRSVWLVRKAKKKGRRTLMWAHTTPEDTAGVFRIARYLGPLIGRYYIWAYSQADLVLCPTVYTREILIRHGLDASRLAVQTNGVDLKTFYPDPARRDAARREFGLTGLVAGMVGSAIPRKGIGRFLALAREFPGNEFRWFGKVYSSLLVKTLPANLPANARFTGFVEDAAAAFNALDIFLFPSHEENQGMVILEAAAVGLPIIVYDLPAYRGWLRHGENCLIAHDDNGFSAHFRRLITDASLRDRLKAGALRLAEVESLDQAAARLKGYLTQTHG